MYVNTYNTGIERTITDLLYNYFHNVGLVYPTGDKIYAQAPKVENITTQMIKRPKAGWKLMASITALVP